MVQPILDLPYRGKLLCAQENNSENGRTHNNKYENTRYALDFTVDNKTPFKVLASANGLVKIWKCCNHKSGNCECGLGFGNQIRVYHNGYFTFYSHLSKIYVKNNQYVKCGQIIGLSGKTGFAGTLHLHWTLGKESIGSKTLKGNFIPFWSIKALKIKIKHQNQRKIVSSIYFKEGKSYSSLHL